MTEVKIKNTLIVQPAKPSYNGHVTLTELDIFGAKFDYTELVYFYKPNDDDESSTKYFSLVRESLSRILVHFYPFAGRLLTNYHHNPPTMVLQCGSACADGGGAVLIEAELNKELAEFGDFSDHYKFTHLIPSLDDQGYDRQNRDQMHKIPLFLVQLTIFRCGGLSLGISLSHVIDGRSLGHFLNEWARISRGEPLEKHPFMDRPILTKGGDQPPPSEELGNDIVIDESSLKTLEEFENTTIAILPLTKNQVEKLKRAASTTRIEDGTGVPHTNICYSRPNYTRNEVISAHSWRCICKAKGYNVNTDLLVGIGIIADVRGRLQPSLPPEYFGNMISLVQATAPAGQIISNQLAFTCEKLRHAINQVTDDYIRTEIEHTRNQRLLSSSKSDEPEMNLELYVTNWLQLQIHGLDFGWGKEICIRRGLFNLNGSVTIMTGELQGDNNKHDEEGVPINVVICLKKPHMDNFKKFFYEDLISE